MILFLDFDGVLHPDPCIDAMRLFEQAGRLSEVLERFPEVGVVLSTAWRAKREEDELLALLPESLRTRVIGVTPRFDRAATAPARVPYPRHAEIERWLELHDMRDASWWALDDRADLFAPYCENLLLCDASIGFDAEMAERLRSVLSLARARAARDVDFLLV